MSGSRYVVPNEQHSDPTGVPYAGGYLYFYGTGTSTPLSTFQDPALSVPNPNPVVLDTAGRAGNVFLMLSPAYRCVLQDANNNVIWDLDPIGPGAGGAAIVTQVPLGGCVFGYWPSIPSGWLLCDGSAVSRSTYSALFALWGTTFGPGDGATTFNVPDLRGRVPAGADDMGGVAANRLTSGVSGVDGTTIGAAGGDENAQTDNLVISNTLSFAVIDPGHEHFQDLVYGTPTVPIMGIGSGETIVSEAGTTDLSYTNISLEATGSIAIASSLLGGSQNVQPTLVGQWICFAT